MKATPPAVVLLASTTPVSGSTPEVSNPQREFCSTDKFIGIQIINYSGSQALHCQDVQAKLEGALAKVQAISPVPLDGPMIKITNQSLARGSTYSWVTTTMTMGIPDLSLFDAHLVFFMHELGHKIFYEYFASRMPAVMERKPIFEAYVNYLRRCQISASPDANCAMDTTPAVLQDANDSMGQDFDEFFYVSNAHNELFADVVAVLAAGNPDALAWAVGGCGKAVDFCEHRSFTVKSIDTFAGTNSYTRITSLKVDLWNQWLTPRLGNPSQALNELALALVDDSVTHYREDYKMIEGMMALTEVKRLRSLFSLKSP